MKSLTDYSGQVVIVLGRDAVLPLTYGTGTESAILLPQIVMRAGEGLTEAEIGADLRRWRRSRGTVIKSTRPSVVPTALTKATECHCPVGIE